MPALTQINKTALLPQAGRRARQLRMPALVTSVITSMA
jgi:hypothetical protein